MIEAILVDAPLEEVKRRLAQRSSGTSRLQQRMESNPYQLSRSERHYRNILDAVAAQSRRPLESIELENTSANGIEAAANKVVLAINALRRSRSG